MTSVQERARHQRGAVVHCTNYTSPYPGSFVPMLAAAARRSREGGYETTVCLDEEAYGRDWLEEIRRHADIRFIRRSGTWHDMRALVRVLSECAGTGPVILHTHFGAYDHAAALTRMTRARTRVVWHLHSSRNRPIRLRTHLYGFVAGHVVDRTICVSDEICAEVSRSWHPPTQLRVLPNAIDLDRFPPIDEQERARARQSLGIPSATRVVLHFAWNWKVKGGDRLLASASRFAGHPDVMFVTVVGGDAPRDQLVGHPRVRPLEPRADVGELYAAADVFLNSSRSEGMPYALLEALSRGLPVVATDLPVQGRVLAGLPGARVVPATPEAISRALHEILAASDVTRREWAAAARQRLEQQYGLDQWADRLVGFYDQLVGASEA